MRHLKAMGLARLFTFYCVCSLVVAVPLFDASAGTVRAARTERAIIELDPDEIFRVGDTIEIRDARGQQKALAVVTTIRGRRAMTKIKSGEATPGDKATLRGRTTRSENETAAEIAPFTFSTTVRKNLLVGASNESQSIRLSSSTRVNMGGISPLVRGSLSGPFRPDMEWEAGANFEYFQTTGSISTLACRSSSNCHVDMLNLTPFGRIGWRPLGDKFLSSQVRGGMDAIVPLVVSSNIIDTTPFQPLILFVGGWAGRLNLSDNTWMPIAAEMGWHFGSTDATLMRFMAFAGYSW